MKLHRSAKIERKLLSENRAAIIRRLTHKSRVPERGSLSGGRKRRGRREKERERPSANSTYLAIARVTTITLHGPLLAWVNAKSIVSIECARFLRARSCVRMDLFSLTSENLNSLLPTVINILSPPIDPSIDPSIDPWHQSSRGAG